MPFRKFLGLVIMLCVFFRLLTTAIAFEPLHCNSTHAANDFENASEIVTGRVIGIERETESIIEDGSESLVFHYYAKMLIADVYKGSLNPGDEIRLIIGTYSQTKEDNGSPTELALYHSHHFLDLHINNVYLLCLDIQKNDLDPDAPKDSAWHLRSHHFSVHQIIHNWIKTNTTRPDGKTITTLKSIKSICRSVGRNAYDKPIPFDSFLDEMQLKSKK